MIGFIKSDVFLYTTLGLVLVIAFGWVDQLSSYLQDFGVYGWAYVIYRMEKHHTLLKALTDTEDGGENND